MVSPSQRRAGLKSSITLESASAALKLELRPMTRLATPVVLSELGWMSMGIVDTIMVGHLNATAMGAVSIGGILFYTVAGIGLGMRLGLDTFVSHSYGAGRIDQCHHWLLNGVYLAFPLSLVLMGVVWLGMPLLGHFDIDAGVLHDAIPYLKALSWATCPLLLYFAFR